MSPRTRGLCSSDTAPRKRNIEGNRRIREVVHMAQLVRKMDSEILALMIQVLFIVGCGLS